MTVHNEPLVGSRDLLAKVSVWQQIRAALSNCAKTTAARAVELDLADTTIRRTLERHRASGDVTNPVENETALRYDMSHVSYDCRACSPSRAASNSPEGVRHDTSL